jgi:hypothetical protein
MREISLSEVLVRRDKVYVNKKRPYIYRSSSGYLVTPKYHVILIMYILCYTMRSRDS